MILTIMNYVNKKVVSKKKKNLSKQCSKQLLSNNWSNHVHGNVSTTTAIELQCVHFLLSLNE